MGMRVHSSSLSVATQNSDTFYGLAHQQNDTQYLDVRDQESSIMGSHSQNVTYKPPPGWVIANYKVEEHVKWGDSRYRASLVAGGSRFTARSELESRFNEKMDRSDGEKKHELQRQKDAYLSTYNEINASHQTLVLNATTTGGGILRYGARLHIEVEVELVDLRFENAVEEIESRYLKLKEEI